MKQKTPSFVLPEEIADDLLAEANFQLSEAQREELAQEDRVDAIGLFLETLAALEAGGVSFPHAYDVPAKGVQDALAALSAEALEEAADEVSDMIESAVDNPFEPAYLDTLGSRLDWILMYRQRFHRRLVGARLVLEKKHPGQKDEQVSNTSLSQKQRQAVEYFDSLVKPRAWGLVFRNRVREGHALMIRPEERERYWWWFEGIDLRWEPLAFASDLAELIERYPSFERYFNRLRRASRVQLGKTVPEETQSKAAHRQELPASAMAETMVETATPTTDGIELAASSPNAKVLKKLGSCSTLTLTAYGGYRLWLEVLHPDHLEGEPCIKLPSGRTDAAERAGDLWVWTFGGKLPQTVFLICDLNGKPLKEEISLA
jgi:hypothetical protein